MKKILTIFERDQNMKITTNKVVDLEGAIATEKVDGTNVRLTVRNHILIRVEKRRNPSKLEKAKGITTPWYLDAYEYQPEDKFIYEAAKNTPLDDIPDGEWSGEAYGPKIQGNPLNYDNHKVFLFSHQPTLEKHTLSAIPTSYDLLKRDLTLIRSTFNREVGIEGVVWWKDGAPIGKIKVKDFK